MSRFAVYLRRSAAAHNVTGLNGLTFPVAEDTGRFDSDARYVWGPASDRMHTPPLSNTGHGVDQTNPVCIYASKSKLDPILLDQIARLMEAGIVVCGLHTDATDTALTADQVRAQEGF